ncbi:MAG: hypothetical protein EBU82_09520 [Flavobacteriia bacterium]|nr:hypothetical protein [Flavobacteriia bacterium]
MLGLTKFYTHQNHQDLSPLSEGKKQIFPPPSSPRRRATSKRFQQKSPVLANEGFSVWDFDSIIESLL